MSVDEPSAPGPAPDRRNVLLGGAITGTAILCGATACSGASESQTARIAADQIPVGGAIAVSSAAVVFTQPVKGTFKAFSSICPHAGGKITREVDGVLICPLHGSRFDPSTGAVVQGPAATGLKELTARVEGSDVVAS